jgi:hypothetical protein
MKEISERLGQRENVANKGAEFEKIDVQGVQRSERRTEGNLKCRPPHCGLLSYVDR